MIPAVRYQDLIESPQNAIPTNFRLNDTSFNLQFSKRQLRRKVESLEDTQDYEIFRTGDGQRGWVLLYNKSEQKTDFALIYRTIHKNWLPPAVTSNIIWSDATSPYTSKLAGRMFFEFLVGRYKTILSDGLQTPNGKRFWQRQMTDAAQKGFRIGLVNFNSRKVDWYVPTTGSFQRWLSQIDMVAYGDADKFRGLRFEIIATPS